MVKAAEAEELLWFTPVRRHQQKKTKFRKSA